MAKVNFKQIDLLRKRRTSNYLLDPYFIDNKKYIKKGIFSSLIIIIITLVLGMPFILRTKFLEHKKEKIKIYSDEYDLLQKKLDEESKQLKNISVFNKDLKNSIMNISSSSALFQEIALIIPKDIQLLEVISKGNSLTFVAKLFNLEYLETLNSFLINLDNSELVEFADIDLKEIKISNEDSDDKSYKFIINTNISNEYTELNKNYLIKLGSFGLLKRISILKSLEEDFD